jgi:hypothetical protein
MSDLTSARGRPFDGWSLGAVGLAVAAVAAWALAGTVSDSLYLPAGLLGAIAFAAGVKGYRDARADGRPSWAPLAAAIVGGALAGFVLAFAIAWAIS